MNKSEIIESLAKQYGHLPNVEVEKIFEKIISTFSESLSTGERIEIRGFGCFSVKKREERGARNPKTGEKIQVPAKRTIHFKSSKDMQKILNEKK